MRDRMEALVRQTQDTVCRALEAFDGTSFREDVWTREGGGGGRTRTLAEGPHLEKAGVNVSSVHGVLPPEVARAARGRGVLIPEGDVRFFATGVSLVIHPRNPFCPTTHANYRYFELEREDGPSTWWFGGGTDMTPNYLLEEDVKHFHGVLKATCDGFDPGHYPRFKAECDDYFLIPHRGERRGVGGIFFDNLNDQPAGAVFEFVAACAGAIVPAIVPIYERRRDWWYDRTHRHWQLLRRGRYAEFNLVYDRGTTFGLRTNGRTESILMSLPPLAAWEYDVQPAPGTSEAELVDVLRTPRAWL